MTTQGMLVTAFVVGLLSALGPCVAPRYAFLAVHTMAGARWPMLLAFAFGCIAGYLMFACAGVSIAVLGVGSHVVYAFLAIGLVVCGIRSLISDSHKACRSGVIGRIASASLGSAFLSGAASSLVVSPCCTPVAITLGIQAAHGDVPLAMGILAAFAMGHLMPLALIAGAARSHLRERLAMPSDAWATISGTVLTAIGGLYAILA